LRTFAVENVNDCAEMLTFAVRFAAFTMLNFAVPVAEGAGSDVRVNFVQVLSGPFGVRVVFVGAAVPAART